MLLNFNFQIVKDNFWFCQIDLTYSLRFYSPFNIFLFNIYYGISCFYNQVLDDNSDKEMQVDVIIWQLLNG